MIDPQPYMIAWRRWYFRGPSPQIPSGRSVPNISKGATNASARPAELMIARRALVRSPTKPWMRFPVGRYSGSSPSGNNQIGGALKAGIVPNTNGAVTSAVLVHLRVEPAHFDWRWRERPALALLAWEALGSRSAGEATPHPSGVNWNDN